MALGSSNIKINDVRNALGETTNSLKGLCQSPGINKWAKWKPLPIATSLNETIIKDIDRGLVFGTFQTFAKCAEALEQGRGFQNIQYNKPQNNFRLGDFRNYDKDTYEGLAKLTYQSKTNEVRVDTVAGFSFKEMVQNYKKFNNQTFQLCLMVWKKNLYNQGITLTSITNVVGASGANTIGMALSNQTILDHYGEGTYYYTFVIHNKSVSKTETKTFAAFSGSGYTIVPLSNNFGVTTITDSGSGSGSGSGGTDPISEFSNVDYELQTSQIGAYKIKIRSFDYIAYNSNYSAYKYKIDLVLDGLSNNPTIINLFTSSNKVAAGSNSGNKSYVNEKYDEQPYYDFITSAELRISFINDSGVIQGNSTYYPIT